MLPASSRANYSHRAHPRKNWNWEEWEWNQGRKRKKKAAVCVVLVTYLHLYNGTKETNVIVFWKAIFAVAAFFFWLDFASWLSG